MIGHELQYSSSHLGEPPRNGDAQAITAADRGYIFEKLFEGNAFAAENVSMADLSAFHGKDQARCDVAHVDEIQDEIEIELKALAEKMPEHRCRRCKVMVVRPDRHCRAADDHRKTRRGGFHR